MTTHRTTKRASIRITHHDAVEGAAPALDADNPPNGIDYLFQEKQDDVSTLNHSLPDANSKTRLTQDLDSAFEPHREKNTVIDMDSTIKVRRGRQKLCNSINTTTGKPYKLRSDGAGCHIAGHRVKL